MSNLFNPFVFKFLSGSIVGEGESLHSPAAQKPVKPTISNNFPNQLIPRHIYFFLW
jgi:hypothetical protein